MYEEEVLWSQEGEELGESSEAIWREVDGEVDEVERERKAKASEGEG